MTTRVKHHSTLIYYDKPLLSIGQDRFGCQYLVLLAEETVDESVLLATPITGQRLEEIKGGQFDVAAAFREPESEQFLVYRFYDGEFRSTFDFESINHDEVQIGWLPDEGLFVELEATAGLSEASLSRNKPLLSLHLTPSSSQNQNAVSAEVLTQLISVVQRVLMHGCKRAYKVAHEKIAEEYRTSGRPIPEPTKVNQDAFTLDAVAIAPGSFEIVLAPQANADMFGFGEISFAMKYFDKLNSLATNPDESVDFLMSHRGRFAAAYKSFISLVYESKTLVSYGWTMPSLPEPQGGALCTKAN